MRTQAEPQFPFSYRGGVAAVIGLLHLVCFVQVQQARDFAAFPEPWLGYLVPVLAAGMALAVLNALSILPWQLRMVLILLRIVTVYVIVIPVRFYPWAAITLFFAFCLEFYLVLSLPAATGFAALLILWYQIIPPAEFIWGQPNRSISDHDAFLGLSYSVLILLVVAAARLTWNKYRENRRQVRHQAVVIQEMARANMDFQEYAVTVERESMEVERKRITREIHDTMGYTLTSLRVLFEAGDILIDRDPKELRRLMAEARVQLDQTQQEIRLALRDLRAVEVKSFPILKRIRHLVQNFSRATGVQVSLETTNVRAGLPAAVEDILYRGVQEGMTNAFLHGRAKRIEIILHSTGTAITLVLIDDGLGSKQSEEGIGLRGMRERLAPLGGSLAVMNLQPGFKLALSIPFREESDEDSTDTR